MASSRVGDWIETASGREFWPLDPRPEEIHIEDIATALSKLCRFGGHCKSFYSVAEHCALASEFVPTGIALEALLHDAAEAYLSDIPRPLKRLPEFAAYRAAETKLEQAIAARFGLVYPWPEEVKKIDDRLLHTEAGQLMPSAIWVRPELVLPGVTIRGLEPEEARRVFIRVFNLYKRGA